MSYPQLNPFIQKPFVMTIDGKAVESPATLGVENPATGKELARCPDASREQLDAAVSGAHRSFKNWSRTSSEERRAVLHAMAETLEAHAEELGTLITAEQGKPLAAGRAEPAAMGPGSLRGFAAMDLPTETLIEDESRDAVMYRRPIGVVGAIIPWNYPIHTTLQKAAPALRAGNTLIVKPSPYTPLATLRMMEILKDVMPPGIVQTLSGGDDLGVWMAEHPGIDKISFTGSTPTGRRVMASAAPTLKRLTLELGGNDAGIVLPDIDPSEVAPMLVRSAFNNTGQVCHALKRLFVHEDLYAEMLAALCTAANALRVGDGMDETTDLGPLANAMQLKIVSGYVEDARNQGARILCGGNPLDQDGHFYPPTIVADAREGMQLVDEEQFGPALPVLQYQDIDEAISRANASDKGLSGSVWTQDVSRGQELAAQLECGTAWVNQHSAQPTANHVLLPFGGVKASGMGRERGDVGLLEYTQTQVINTRKHLE